MSLTPNMEQRNLSLESYTSQRPEAFASPGHNLFDIMIGYLIAERIEEPYTKTLLVFRALSAVAMPFFYWAAIRFHLDRYRLYEAMERGKFCF